MPDWEDSTQLEAGVTREQPAIREEAEPPTAEERTASSGVQPPPLRQSKLGWVAFIIAVVGLGTSVGLLWVRSDREAARAHAEADQRVAAETRAVKAEHALTALAAHAAELEEEVKKAAAERDAALADAKAVRDKLLAGERAAPTAGAKAPPTKKKRRR